MVTDKIISFAEYARYAIIAHVVHLVNRDYEAMCRDYYTLEFMDPSIDTSPIAPALANFFDDVLENSVSQLNFKSLGMRLVKISAAALSVLQCVFALNMMLVTHAVDGLGEILLAYPFQVCSTL